MKLFSRKKEPQNIQLYAPFAGTCVDITEVPDAVFAQKMMGDGVAIIQREDMVYAPVAGEISMIAHTKHAFGIDVAPGLQVLVHVGLETVALNGEGFEILVKEHQTVKAGDPIMKVDRKRMEEKDIKLIVPIVIMDENSSPLEKPSLGKEVTANRDIIMEIKK